MKCAIMMLAVGLILGGGPAKAFAQKPSSPSAGGRPTVQLRVCNQSGRNATVAVSYVEVGASSFTNRGWYDVAAGACRELVTTDNATFYFYADATDGSGRRWSGNHSLCVQYPGPYTFPSTGSTTCSSNQELRDFSVFQTREPGSWTWNLNP